jgi:hypothetical protein
MGTLKNSGNIGGLWWELGLGMGRWGKMYEDKQAVWIATIYLTVCALCMLAAICNFNF